MGLQLNFKGKTPGERTAHLAVSAADYLAHSGQDAVFKTVWMKLSTLMCWDAMLYCAWAANGIQCQDVDTVKPNFGVAQSDNFARVFPQPFQYANSAGVLKGLPVGAMIGFIHTNKMPNSLFHAMIHVGEGWGAGSKNGCVLQSASSDAWQRLNIGAFFCGSHDYMQFHKDDKIIYRAVTGQTI